MKNDVRDWASGHLYIKFPLAPSLEGVILEFNIEEMLNAFGHEKIGVEYGCSEQWIDLKDVNRSQIPLFLQWLDFEFSKKYSRRMVFYVTYFKGKYSHIDLRFHSYGEDGELWLAENLDEYKNAIIRYIS